VQCTITGAGVPADIAADARWQMKRKMVTSATPYVRPMTTLCNVPRLHDMVSDATIIASAHGDIALV